MCVCVCVLLLMYLYHAPVRLLPITTAFKPPFCLCPVYAGDTLTTGPCVYVSSCICLSVLIRKKGKVKINWKKRQDTDPAGSKGGMTLQGQSQNGPIQEADKL